MARKFKPGDRVEVLSLDDRDGLSRFGVVIMAQDPKDLHGKRSIPVHHDGHTYKEWEILVCPRNPKGTDYHMYPYNELRLVESLEDAETEALKSIADSASKTGESDENLR